MDVYCGIDWAEDHHDIALVDRDGQPAGPPPDQRRRGRAHRCCWPCSPSTATAPDDPVPVAIETPRGLLIACLRATGRQVYPINPMAVARYRDRHSVAGRKSDHGDAVVLANILRTDVHAHRPLPADYRAGPGHRRAGPRPARRRLGPHQRAQQAPLPPARVLPRLPGRLRRRPRRHHSAPRPGSSWPPPPPPPPPPRSPSPSCGRCCARPAAAAASTPRPPGCVRRSAPRRCASSRSSRQAMGRQALALLGQLDAACASRRRPRASHRRVF